MIDNNKCTLANFVMEFITDVKEFMIQALVNFNFVNLIIDFLMRKKHYKVDLKVWRYYWKGLEVFLTDCLVSMRLEYLLNLLYDLLTMICCHLNFIKLIKFDQFSFVFFGAMLLFFYLSLIIYNLCSSFS